MFHRTWLNGSDSEIRLHNYMLNLHQETVSKKKKKEIKSVWKQPPESNTAGEWIYRCWLITCSQLCEPQAAHRVCSRWDPLHHSAKYQKIKMSQHPHPRTLPRVTRVGCSPWQKKGRLFPGLQSSRGSLWSSGTPEMRDGGSNAQTKQ